MRKYRVVLTAVIAALAAAALLFVASSQEGLEFAGESIGKVDSSGMSISFSVCNPAVVPVFLSGATGEIAGSGDLNATLEIRGRGIGPLSSGTVGATVRFAGPGAMARFVDMVMGNSTSQASGNLTVSERLLGVLPYSYSKTYDGRSLSGMVLGNVRWACKDKPDNAGNMMQRLEVARAQISAANLLYLGGG